MDADKPCHAALWGRHEPAAACVAHLRWAISRRNSMLCCFLASGYLLASQVDSQSTSVAFISTLCMLCQSQHDAGGHFEHASEMRWAARHVS